MALRLFIHAFQTIFGNFKQARKLSVLPLFGALLLLTFAAYFAGQSGSGLLTFILIAAAGLVFVFVLGFVACGWHRYILLEEEPRLNGPASDRAFPYVGKSILLTLWVVLLCIPILIVMGLVGFSLLGADGAIGSGATDYGMEDAVFEIVFGAAFGAIFLMYALVLPASALETPMTFKESRQYTMSIGWNIVGVAVLIAAFNAVVGFVATFLFGSGSIMGFVVGLAVQWLSLMVGISILTTLYGHLVEGRDLPT